MNRTHYRAIAGIFKYVEPQTEEGVKVKKALVAGLVILFGVDNPKFNREEFFKRCGIQEM